MRETSFLLVGFGVLAAMASATCGGSVVFEPPGGGPGTGGAGGGSTSSSSNSTSQVTTSVVTTTVTSSNTGPQPQTSVVSSVSSGPDPDCLSCGGFLGGEGDFEELCPKAEELYFAFVACVCETGCPVECGEACEGDEADDDCFECFEVVCEQQILDCFDDQ